MTHSSRQVRTQSGQVTFVLVLALVIGALGQGGHLTPSARAASDNGTARYPDLRQDKSLFKQFLKDPYPVRSVRFMKPGKDVLVDGKPLSGYIAFEGAIQDGTFYLRHDADAPGQPEEYVSKGNVSGLSTKGIYWTLKDGAASGEGGSVNVTPDAVEDHDAMTEGKFNAKNGLMSLRTACRYGLFLLVPESLAWDGERFKARYFTPKWPHQTNTIPVTGEVLGYTNNVPTAIRMESSSPSWEVDATVLHYKYDFSITNRFYPVRIRSEAVIGNGRRIPGFSVDIPKIEFGKADLSNGGYQPKDFLPSNTTTPPDLYISSNDAVYWVSENGLSKVGPPRQAKHPSRRFLAWTATVGIVLLSATAILVVVRKNKQAHRQNTNNKTKTKR